jgi:hypothetical protein
LAVSNIKDTTIGAHKGDTENPGHREAHAIDALDGYNTVATAKAKLK